LVCGVVVWGLGPSPHTPTPQPPNPQSPIPNPQFKKVKLNLL